MPDRPPSILAGWLDGWRRRRARRGGSPEARAYRGQRVRAIQAALRATPPGFIYLAGDSHAELMGQPAFGDRPVVNGGIGGVTASSYAAELDRLRFGVRAVDCVVFVGSNDIARVNAPLAPGGVERFARDATAVVARLRARSDRVWIAALPPIRPNAPYPQVLEAVGAYNDRLAAIARAEGCRFIDPFARLRNGNSGLAVDGVTQDGVHLRDYRSVARELDGLLAR